MTGSTKHLHAVLVAGQLETALASNPSTVEIVEQEGSVYLLRLDAHGECIADTWHESVEAAKEQARFEFGIEGEHWEDIGPQHGAACALNP